MFGRIIALTRKEILALVRDPRGRAILIGPPIAQLIIFTYAATLDVNNVRIAVFDQDRSAISVELVQRMAGSSTFSRVDYVDNMAALGAAIDAQDVLLALHIPQTFGPDVATGRGGNVQVILDGRRSNAAQIALGYTNSIVGAFNEDILERTGQQTGSRVEIVTRHWFNPNLNYRWFIVPSLIGSITLLVGLSVTALSVARERELGTFDQLLVSPIQPSEILVGKTLPSLMIGLFHGTLFLLTALFVFRIPFEGSFIVLYLSMAIYLLAVIGVGLFVSSISATQQQAFLYSFLFGAPAILLSGFATPVENMPNWLQTISLVNPLRHFLVIVNGVFTKDMPLDVIWQNLMPLIVISAATLMIAGWLFRNRLG